MAEIIARSQRKFVMFATSHADIIILFGRDQQPTEDISAMIQNSNPIGPRSFNFLEHPVLAAYLRAKEYDAYYSSLKTYRKRSDFHQQFLDAIDDFLRKTEIKENRYLIDSTMMLPSSADLLATNPLDKARKKHGIGTQLLELSGLQIPITLENLKSTYHQAARLYHPDLGGDHEAMISVNSAFSFLHEIISDSESIQQSRLGSHDDANITVLNCNFYRHYFTKRFFNILLSDWNLDAALTVIVCILNTEWDIKTSKTQEHLLIDLVYPICLLATQLSFAGMQAEASQAYKIAKHLSRVAKRSSYIHKRDLREAEISLSGPAVPAPSISNARRAENMLRLGVIDQKKYERALIRFSRAKIKEDLEYANAEETLGKFRKQREFMNLPIDECIDRQVMQGGFVPETQYYKERIKDITKEQQAEYFHAFSTSGGLSLIRKYFFVRRMGLFESALFFPDQTDSMSVMIELDLLKNIYADKSCYLTDVIDMVRILQSQSLDERRERSQIIKSIISGDAASAHGIMGQFIFYNIRLALVSIHSQEYRELVSRPLSDLRRTQKTGNFSVNIVKT